ncbi:MAG: FlgD immunoglobulin-like domain containing protein, partial [Candidatus Poribacteria bacterium]
VLTTDVDPAEGGVVTASGATFTLGETATLTAVPATGYEFVHWNDEPASTGNPATFTVTGDATHTALFRLTTHTITARSEPSEGGVVAPALVTAEYGSVVYVTATAASAFLFDGWGGAGAGTENPLAVLVTRDTELIANFVAKPTATLALNGAEAALNERSVTVSARVAPEVGAEVVAAAFSLTYDTAEIASLVVDEEQATAAGWTVTQLAVPGRVDVLALAVGPPSATGFAFSVGVAAADGYWGEADVSVADVSLNQDGVVTVSTSGSVFFPRVSLVAAPAAVDEPAVWSATIVVPSDASSARVFYRRGGDAEYTAAPMTSGSPGVWTASTMRGIAYYMTATAHDGREYATGTATSPVDIPVRGEESIALIPTVYAPSRWNLVAPTANPDLTGGGDAFGLVGPAYSAFAGTASSPQWLAWRWQATEQEWRPAVAYDQYLASTDGFVPGSPWFVVVEDDASLDFTLGGVSVDATADFVAPLRLGWNLLSNPFAYPVDWSDASVRIQYAGVQTDPTTARSRGWVHDRIFWYDHEAGSYVPQASGAALPFAVSAGQGFWQYASVDGAELAIPGVEAFPVDPPVPPAAPSLMTSDQWQVGLAVGSRASEMSATAAVGRGGWSLDDAIPPSVPDGGGSRVALVGDDDGVSMQLRRSVRPESDDITWTVQVDGTADAALRWNISSVPDEYSVTLEGDHGGDVVDLRANADIAVGDLPEGELTLRAARHAGGFSAAGLHPNYPNPFNPATWIPFTLPRASEVTLSVYASDGSLVRTLPLGRRAAGAHVGRGRAAYWDGRAASGEAAASGVYFYEIRAEGLRGRRRMVLRK